MVKNDYQFRLSLLRKADGAAVGDVAVSPDFAPAVESVRFKAFRRGAIDGKQWDSCAVEIKPTWNDSLGPPCVDDLRVQLLVDGRPVAEETLPTAYLRDLAQAASSRFVEQGLLEAGEVFHYLVKATHAPRGQQPAAGDRFKVRTISPAPPVRDDGDLSGRIERSVYWGEQRGDDDATVIIPKRIVDETVDLSRRAGSQETGGILIGHLRRGAGSPPDVFLDVTAQIPARHTQSGLTKLTFTGDTWTAARDAIHLRGRDEIMVGWWHSHSFFSETCKDCEKRKSNACKASAAFMSAEDCALHRTVFPRAYCVALVIGDSPCSGLEWALFGWRHGVVASRGFWLEGDETKGHRET